MNLEGLRRVVPMEYTESYATATSQGYPMRQDPNTIALGESTTIITIPYSDNDPLSYIINESPSVHTPVLPPSYMSVKPTPSRDLHPGLHRRLNLLCPLTKSNQLGNPCSIHYTCNTLVVVCYVHVVYKWLIARLAFQI